MWLSLGFPCKEAGDSVGALIGLPVPGNTLLCFSLQFPVSPTTRTCSRLAWESHQGPQTGGQPTVGENCEPEETFLSLNWFIWGICYSVERLTSTEADSERLWAQEVTSLLPSPDPRCLAHRLSLPTNSPECLPSGRGGSSHLLCLSQWLLNFVSLGWNWAKHSEGVISHCLFLSNF